MEVLMTKRDIVEYKKHHMITIKNLTKEIDHCESINDYKKAFIISKMINKLNNVYITRLEYILTL